MGVIKVYKIDHKIPKYLFKLREVLVRDFEEYLEDNFVKLTENKRKLIKASVGCFVLNLNKSIISKRDTFGITLDQTNYSKKIVVNGRDTKRKVSYTYTKSLFQFLNQKDYGDLTVGGEVEDYGLVDKQWVATVFSRSYFKLNDKLKTLYTKYVSKPDTFDALDNVLILREEDTRGNKKDKTYRNNEVTKQKVDYVNRYNKFSREVEVTYRDTRLDAQIYKVFNRDFDHGGRSIMVSEYQRLNGEKRDEVVIGGEETCCYDYKGFEPSIAYSIKQEIMEGDPYTLEVLHEKGYEVKTARKLAKAIFIICLNCDNITQAKRALSMWISENMDLENLYEKGKIPSKMIPTAEVIEIMLDHHHMIGEVFFSSHRGYCVQNVGAEINDFVLDSMIQNHKTLVIQVHDDFRCTVEKEKELKETMHKAYEYVLGFSDNCYIVKES